MSRTAANEPVARSTSAPPSSQPVPLLALAPQAARPLPIDKDELTRRRRRLLRVAMALIVAAGAMCVVAIRIALVRTPASADPPPIVAATPRGGGVGVSVVVEAGDTPFKARQLALLEAAQAAPDKLLLLNIVPAVTDDLLAGGTVLKDEHFSDENGERRFDAVVDVAAVASALCVRVDDNYQPTVLVNVEEHGEANSDVALRLVDAFASACVMAQAQALPFGKDTGVAKRQGTKWLVDGSLETSDGAVNGTLHLRDVARGRVVAMRTTPMDSAIAGAVDDWRDEFVRVMAREWQPQNARIEIKSFHNREAYNALAHAVAKLPYVAAFVPGGHVTDDDVARLDFMALGDPIRAGAALDGLELDGMRIKIVSASSTSIVGRLVSDR